MDSENISQKKSSSYFQQVFASVRPDFEKATYAAIWAGGREPGAVADRYFALQQFHAVVWKFKWEFSALRHYYRQHAIASAYRWSGQLKHTAEPIQVPHTQQSIHFKDDYFDSVIYDVVLGGYVAMYHKLEAMVEYLISLSKGKEFGVMLENQNPVDYESVLREAGVSLKDLAQVGSTTKNYDKHIHRIREIANRSKHQGGYLKGASEILTEYLPGQDRRHRIQVSLDDFYFDFWYVERYMTVISDLVMTACHVVILVKEIKSAELEEVPIPKGQTKDEYVNRLREVTTEKEKDLLRAVDDFKKGVLSDQHPGPTQI